MAWESIQLKGINGTQMTPYGATTCNYQDYHDFSLSENGGAGRRKFSDFVEYLGDNFLIHAETGTQGPGEEMVFIDSYNDGHFVIQDSVTLPYYDSSSGKYRSAYYARILFDGEIIGSCGGAVSSTGSAIYCDKIYFGFLIDESRHYGQVVSWDHHASASDQHLLSQETATKPTSKYSLVYTAIKPRIYIPPIIKVNYMIPEGDYQYCKLTYKKDKQPESVNDGTIIDIDATQSECTIEGLEENNNYWFTIYTDKNESPPFPYTVEEL